MVSPRYVEILPASVPAGLRWDAAPDPRVCYAHGKPTAALATAGATYKRVSDGANGRVSFYQKVGR